MGFFNKLKNGLGVGTAKVTLVETPTQISKDTKKIEGKVSITAQSDQKVKSISVVLVKRYYGGDPENSAPNDENMASTRLDGFDIKKDETRAIPFTLSIADNSISMSMFSTHVYELDVAVDLEGVAFDPKTVHRLNYV